MGTESLGNRGPIAGLESPFGKARSMVFPRSVLAGHGVLSELGNSCRGFDFPSHGAVITGPKTAGLAGYRAVEILKASGFEVTTIIAGDPTNDEADRVGRELDTAGARFVVGVGGGSKIDIAKVVAHRLRIPFVSVPTSAAHDGISSPRASLHGAGRVTSTEAVVPVGVLADTSVIVQAPFRLLASGLCRRHLELHRLPRLEAGRPPSQRGVLQHGRDPRRVRRPGDRRAREPDQAQPRGVGLDRDPSSHRRRDRNERRRLVRPCSGSEHLFSHALDRAAQRPALHGEQCGVGAIMMMYLHGGDWRKVRTALHAIGAPITAKELGVTTEEIIEALVGAHAVRPERYTILGDNGLTREAAERLANVTGVIG